MSTAAGIVSATPCGMPAAAGCVTSTARCVTSTAGCVTATATAAVTPTAVLREGRRGACQHPPQSARRQ
jgi:hypothetical protein